ncbi:hypothetical protein QVD17_04267 [Tagetes erecta]|uniref:Uncharacterized protein n=1 Tax=Tagetes erecta TaxID=13708 RepID=A0AAD8LF70_TARER|nr:hypothetical protein QVD17_04267 [Tagetes erecta]
MDHICAYFHHNHNITWYGCALLYRLYVLHNPENLSKDCLPNFLFCSSTTFILQPYNYNYRSIFSKPSLRNRSHSPDVVYLIEDIHLNRPIRLRIHSKTFNHRTVRCVMFDVEQDFTRKKRFIQ